MSASKSALYYLHAPALSVTPHHNAFAPFVCRASNEHPRPPAPPSAVLEVRFQFVEQLSDAVLLYVVDRLLVHASRAFVSAHQLPHPLQNVPAIDLVIERVEPSLGICLSRPVEHSLQFSSVLPRGYSRHLALTHPSQHVRVNEVAPFPSPRSVVRSAQPVHMPPPTPSHKHPFPDHRYRRHPPAQFAGRCAASVSPVPAVPSNVPCPLRRVLQLHSIFTPSVAFALKSRLCTPSLPPTRALSLHAQASL